MYMICIRIHASHKHSLNRILAKEWEYETVHFWNYSGHWRSLLLRAYYQEFFSQSRSIIIESEQLKNYLWIISFYTMDCCVCILFLSEAKENFLHENNNIHINEMEHLESGSNGKLYAKCRHYVWAICIPKKYLQCHR